MILNRMFSSQVSGVHFWHWLFGWIFFCTYSCIHALWHGGDQPVRLHRCNRKPRLLWHLPSGHLNCSKLFFSTTNQRISIGFCSVCSSIKPGKIMCVQVPRPVDNQDTLGLVFPVKGVDDGLPGSSWGSRRRGFQCSENLYRYLKVLSWFVCDTFFKVIRKTSYYAFLTCNSYSPNLQLILNT